MTPVAVIGMGCRLPGGIDSPAELWEALLRGDDHVTVVPRERWDAEEYYDPEPGVPGRSVSKWGAFLDDVAGFDADFFGISEREATAIDPQHRLLLETSWEAIEHAGIDPRALAGTRTGVFVGMTHADYQLLAADANAIEGPYGFTGNNFSLASGRVAYHLGAHGPAYTVDSACSSSLLSVHMACRSLHDGESDLAIAGGVSVMFEPRKMSSGSAQGMLSPTGRCHAFDVNADGFTGGEGSAVLLLKRLDDALADGDRVLAVVRGSAANQDGHTVNIAVPSRAAQVDVYRAALAAGDIDPATVGMVEAHGTGTPVGDPIEYASLAEVYGTSSPCALGSVKTNLGHGQSASGAIGMLKAVLSVQHGTVPQNLHFTALPEEMASVDTNLFVPQRTSDWPTNGGHPRRVAVSSYGLSGTNVHAVLEAAPAAPTPVGRPTEDGDAARSLLFALSATSDTEVRRSASRIADWLEGDGSAFDLSDVAYTLARRRSHRPIRTVVKASGRADLVAALRAASVEEVPLAPAVAAGERGPVWVFSGQGAQWAAMGVDLLANEPVFARSVAQLEPLIAAESGFSVTEAMSAPEVVTGIDRIQPTLFAFQVALAETAKSYGVVPGAVIGHSMGEAAAAVVAGALSLEDGVKVICRRSRLMAGVSGSGAMASVELPAQQVLSELASRGVSDVVLSVVASPQSAVVGGSRESVRALIAEWEARGVMAREVAVDVASHSPQVDPVLDDLIDALEDLTPLEPTVPYYSSTLYDPREPAEFDAYYWADNLRHAVRFAAAVQAALEDGYRVFGELSPHPLLTHAVDQNARSLDVRHAALASVRREQALPDGLLDFVADLHNAGAAIDYSALWPDGTLVDVPLPSFTHTPLLLTRDENAHGVAAVAVHPLLGAHVELPETPARHVWQSDVGTAQRPWLDDHRVHDVAAFPGAAYCEMALAAAHQVLDGTAVVRDVTFEQLLLLEDETPLFTVASVTPSGAVTLDIKTHTSEAEVRRASATLTQASPEELNRPTAHDVAQLLAAHPIAVKDSAIKEFYAARGIGYGPSFSGLSTAHTGDSSGASVLAEVSLPGSIRSEQGAYGIHPALLDACFQAVGAHPDILSDASGALMLPLGVREIRAYESTRGAHYCYVRLTSMSSTAVEADLDLLDDNGEILLTVIGLRLGSAVSEDGERERRLNDRLLTIDWHRREAPVAAAAAAHGGDWLLIDGGDPDDAFPSGLADALQGGGVAVSRIGWPADGDHDEAAADVRAALATGALAGVVVVGAPSRDAGDPAVAGVDHVRHFVRIARTLTEGPAESARLYTVTRSAQVIRADEVPNLASGGLRGLIRAIAMEYPTARPTQIDVDDATSPQQVATELLSGSDEDETAWRNGEYHVARLAVSPLQAEERRNAVVYPEREGMRFEVRTPGDLQSAELVSYERTPPGPGQIEVAVSASNLNFADVLVAYGRYPSFEGRLPALGADFAGVVTAVGAGVTDHRIGDRVAGISATGAWCTFVTCDANLAIRIPDGLSNDVAAAVPSAHATAWYALHDLARIRPGNKVLIHSATGGVGQAAVAIAAAAGAEIFATAGSPERRQLLSDMGIRHVYDSRTVEFADQIRRDTAGYGVDVVLNSLPGAAQQAGIELLTFGGRFIEIGKRDIYGDTRMGLFPFRRNLSFHAVDLALLMLVNPDAMRGVLDAVFDRIADGTLPPPQITRYPLADAATAIRAMGAAEHTGKLVLDVPRVGRYSAVVPAQRAPAFRTDGSYVITGGLSGLGLFLAEQMSDAGCGRIVLNGRREPSAEALEAIERIRRRGVEVTVELGDVSAAATAERLVASATETGLPLRGVLHAAAVVEDATLSNLTDDIIDRDWAPKVLGAWRLHEATRTAELDWFCAFSSAAAMIGSPGQGAYAAANSWLDAFGRWRRAAGLPAHIVAWGAWSRIGAGQAMAEVEGMAIEPEDGAYAFDALVRHTRVYSGYAPIAGAPWLADFAKTSPFAEAFAGLGKDRAGSSAFLDELAGMPREEWPARLRRLISEEMGVILRRSVDVDKPLSEYGLDSLGTLELRTRIESATGVRIGSTDVTTVRGLAERLSETIAERTGSPSTAEPVAS